MQISNDERGYDCSYVYPHVKIISTSFVCKGEVISISSCESECDRSNRATSSAIETKEALFTCDQSFAFNDSGNGKFVDTCQCCGKIVTTISDQVSRET